MSKEPREGRAVPAGAGRQCFNCGKTIQAGEVWEVWAQGEACEECSQRRHTENPFPAQPPHLDQPAGAGEPEEQRAVEGVPDRGWLVALAYTVCGAMEMFNRTPVSGMVSREEFTAIDAARTAGTEAARELRDRLEGDAPTPAQPSVRGGERIVLDPLDGLDAVIEGEAVAFMEAWKAARFQHAGDFARQLAVRVVEVMREDTPTPAPTLADGETCDACGHVGRLHYRDPKRARTHGCMARVDSAYTVSNDRACGCHRRRVSEVQPTTSPEAEP